MIREVLVCLSLLGADRDACDGAWLTCVRVAMSADTQGADLAHVVALAYHESRLCSDAESRSGAMGPLQVMPAQCRRWARERIPRQRAGGNAVGRAWWGIERVVRGVSCDVLAAGVWSWLRWLKVAEGDVALAACMYVRGYECGDHPAAQSYGRSVSALAERLQGGQR